MKLFDRMFQKAPAAPLPQRVALTQDFRVDDQGKLSMEARSLDEFDRNSGRLDTAQHMYDAAQAAEALKGLDGKKADFDPRAGHVVAPEHNFEFHPDSGQFQKTGHMNVQGDDQQVTIRKDSSQTGVWNREDQSFQFHYHGYTGQDKGLPYDIVPSGQPTQQNVDAQGVPIKPAVTSLEQAQSLGLARGDNERASEILQTALLFHSQALSLDGTSHDLNPLGNQVVAPNLSPDKLPNVWGAQAIVSQEQLDLQADPHGLLVRGRSTDHGAAILSAQNTDPNTYEVTLHDYAYGEKVVWNKTAGTLSYQMLDLIPNGQY